MLVCPRFWRLPTPGRVVQAFTAELAAHGIPVGDFNVPDHEPSAKELHTLFESLFHATPPTALIFEVAEGAMQWCDPPLAHLCTDGSHIVRRIVRWVRAVSRGRAEREAIGIPATFDPGGTIGPARV